MTLPEFPAALAGWRRSLPDRRRQPTRWLSPYWLSGRRTGGRRTGDRHNVYFDRYTKGEYGLVLAVLVLVVLDTVFTVLHLGHGIEEANPIMEWALETGGILLFALLKVGVTLLALVFLLAHIRFRPTRVLLVGAAAIYLGVLGVHLRVLQLTSLV